MDFYQELPQDWAMALKPILQTKEIKDLQGKLPQDYENQNIFPLRKNIFRAFKLTPLTEVKAIILGQDPYFHPGQAEGLAFSVPLGVKIPSSLKNIHGALEADLEIPAPSHGSLISWAKEGVLLLNTALTVETIITLDKGKEKFQAKAHEKENWQLFTDYVIKIVSQESKPKVFLLWGKEAQKKKDLIDETRHLVLEAVHPSGLSAWRGFKECAHFSKTNEFLRLKGREPINWQLV